VFIGCSVEGLRIAKVIQITLAHSSRPVIWHQGVFGLSSGTLESLVGKVHTFKYAILVLTPDDLLTKRGETSSVARDNVLFELGLFMGALGREHTFIVCDSSVLLPSDLAGITPAKFNLTEATNIVADLGPVCTRLEIEMGLL
jgi:predicted nucleotide-binding protein